MEAVEQVGRAIVDGEWLEAKDIMEDHKESDAAPHLLAGYDAGDEPIKAAQPAPPPLHGGQTEADNRGHRAAITASGEVTGSGASAGGKGGPEDYDTDPQAGGGKFVLRHADKPNEGGDASQHNST